MITALKGIVISQANRIVELDIGPVTLEIGVPNESLLSIGKIAELCIIWHWNSDLGPSLYGFCNKLDREIFQLLILCSGIGPKLALALIGQLGSENIINGIANSDSKILSGVSGVGARKAELIIAQLQPKANQLIHKIDKPELKSLNSYFYQVQQVLESLNYSKAEIQKALDIIRKDNLIAENFTFDYIMRKSLSVLSKKTL